MSLRVRGFGASMRLLTCYSVSDQLRFPPSEHKLQRFISAASPSPLGKDQVTVYDPDYRLAREYKVCYSTFLLFSSLSTYCMYTPCAVAANRNVQTPNFALSKNPVSETTMCRSNPALASALPTTFGNPDES